MTAGEARPMFPVARWAVLAFALVWAPLYAREYGARNFLQLCDVAVLVTLAGLWRGSALLLSSQAVGVLAIDALWTLDVACGWLLGKHPVGGTQYMFDPGIPAFVRALSLFHVAWPVLALWAVRRAGYDRRGWILQSGLAALCIALARLTPPAYNVNFAFRAPFIGAPVGPPAVHVAVCSLVMAVAVFLPTHLVLAKALRPSGKGGAGG